MIIKNILMASLIFVSTLLTIPAQAESFNSLISSNPVSENDFLQPDQAFKLEITEFNSIITANFSVAPGYYLYKEKIKLTKAPKDTQIFLPKGEIKDDPNFGKMEVYHHDFKANITIKNPNDKQINLTVKYQGCSEKGLCYAPISKDFNITLTPQQSNSNSTPINDNPSKLENILQGGNLLIIAILFFGAGLLLSFTPCVLPMIPILSSIIIGSNKDKSLSKIATFNLSLSYVLGMATAYTITGILAGFSGQLLSNVLQNPLVLISSSVLFVVLALSMFGLYELRLPQFIESRLTNTSNNLKSGKIVSVFVMGILSALIVSPCVAAPLAGVLIYISQTHDVVLGGVALFSLSIGMGVPLLLIGASAGALLPKTGKWMNIVRNSFGIVMLGMAVWIVWPVLPTSIKSPVENSLNQNKQILTFTQIKSLSELNEILEQSKGKKIMLDFYADWCTACKELEHTTFADKEVKSSLENTILLQVDVTNNTAADKEILSQFKVFGPPTILFFDENGIEIKSQRIIGYQSPKQFLNTVKNQQ